MSWHKGPSGELDHAWIPDGRDCPQCEVYKLRAELAEARERILALEEAIRCHAGGFSVCERCGHEQDCADDDVVLLTLDRTAPKGEEPS